MPLKTLVKVSEINNLSDARYCAGMGVELVGFCLDENHPKFIELARIREIAVWLSGVKVVGEFIGENVENMNYLAEQLNLDYVQVSHPLRPELLAHIHKPLIVKIQFSENKLAETEKWMEELKQRTTYYLLEIPEGISIQNEGEVLKKLCASYPVILSAPITRDQLPFLLEEIAPAGLGLKGGEEIKPGLKHFDELSEILESLEEE